ncbi:hypothetical protein AX16_008338 [Volvariella volvacea WC 439]|nr:hypothetical protein AX16_008338 [Volvariella volvacea WC 439]
MCPNCRNTLSVVPSDPPDNGDSRILSAIGEPPFFLYCNHCRWDSTQVDITFEKPTGLASKNSTLSYLTNPTISLSLFPAQLQKYEDTVPEALEFERLKEHFEPFLRASSLSSSTTSTHAAGSHVAHSHHLLHTNSITAAASAALARDIPGIGRYNPLARSTSGRSGHGAGKDRSLNKDEMPEYRSRLDISTATNLGGGGGDGDAEFIRHLETMEEVATLEQRWGNSWAMSFHTDDLRPLRIPLHSKRSKRCPVCTHILIKPEQKAQSVRYKIKLVAANYLPAITVALPHTHVVPTPEQLRQRSLGKATDDDKSALGLHAGRTYAFHLALSNPLYDPIQVRLSVQRMHVSAPVSASAGQDGSGNPTTPAAARRPPFAISLPTATFPIAAFAEAWEYDEDEDMYDPDDDGEFASLRGGRGAGGRDDGRGRSKTVGILEKKANMTLVGGEVVIGKEARGNVKFNMLVSYTYRSDDPAPSEGGDDLPTLSRAPKAPEIKTFAFYTVVDLGAIVPREEPRTELDF